MSDEESFERLVPSEMGDEGMLQRHLAGYAFVVAQAPGATLALDFGCGAGYGTEILARHCGPAIGVDLDLAALRYAREHYPSPLAQVCADGLRLPFVSATFDLVVVSQVLEHFAEPALLCRELRRVCRPEAQVFVAVPNQLTQAPAGGAISAFHVQEFAPDTLTGLLSGFFSSVTLYGSYAGPAASRRETTDTWARKSVAKDRLGLRRMLPRGMRQALLRLLRGHLPEARLQGLDGDLLPLYNPQFYQVRQDDLHDAIDLLAVCRC